MNLISKKCMCHEKQFKKGRRAVLNERRLKRCDKEMPCMTSDRMLNPFPKSYKEYFGGKFGNLNIDYILNSIISMLTLMWSFDCACVGEHPFF